MSVAILLSGLANSLPTGDRTLETAAAPLPAQSVKTWLRLTINRGLYHPRSEYAAMGLFQRAPKVCPSAAVTSKSAGCAIPIVLSFE